jgi:hypothetical protein
MRHAESRSVRLTDRALAATPQSADYLTFLRPEAPAKLHAACEVITFSRRGERADNDDGPRPPTQHVPDREATVRFNA